MNNQTVKFKSFRELSQAVNAVNKSEAWAEFLKLKGHTAETFSYLPETLRTSLKFSFAKKVK